MHRREWRTDKDGQYLQAPGLQDAVRMQEGGAPGGTRTKRRFGEDVASCRHGIRHLTLR